MRNKGSSGVVNTSLPRLVNAYAIQGSPIEKVPSNQPLIYSSDKNRWIHQISICQGLEGLTLSNSNADLVNDINTAPGACVLPIGTRTTAVLSSSLTKRLDAAWVAGNNSGGRFSGVSLSNTTYHLFLIQNVSTGVVDAGFDTSVIAANRPSGWSARRIGSILRVSNSILGFNQFGTYFELKTPVSDLNGVEVPTGSTLYQITVPNGITVVTNGVLAAGLPGDTYNLSLSVQSPNQDTQTPIPHQFSSAFRGTLSSYVSPGNDAIVLGTLVLQVMTNSSRQIKFTRTGTYFSNNLYYTTWINLGWSDPSLLKGG